MDGRFDGSIEKVDCAHHKHVEWRFEFSDCIWLGRSSNFSIGDQRYKFEIFSGELRLYRTGPAVTEGPLCRFYLGLKRNDGAYHYCFETRELDLSDVCQSWTEIMTLDCICPEMHSEWNNLAPSGFITAYFRIDLEPPHTDEKLFCIHGFSDMSLPGIGAIQEEECSHHKHVEWKVDYKALKEDDSFYTSPVFRIGKQKFFFELRCDSKYIITRFYRMGPSLTYPVRWWMGVRQGDGTCHPRFDNGLLNTRDEWRVWREILWLRSYSRSFTKKHLLSPDGRLTLFLRMTFEETPAGPEYCSHVDGQVPGDHQFPQDVQTLHEFITFKVEGAEFKMHRAILRIRVPVFGAMFSHDCVENRTGIVHIKDCEPAVFEDFLTFIFVGHFQGMTGKKACALFVIADKYLLDELKSWCFHNVKKLLSDGAFVSTLRLALLYEKMDLLHDVHSFFMKRSKIITHTQEWYDFCSENPEEHYLSVIRKCIT